MRWKMSKSMRAKRIRKEEEVKQLRDELVESDGVLKRNIENPKMQIQIGLIKKGFPSSGGMYDTMIERMNFEARELQMQIESKFEVINPLFQFQKNPEWRTLQRERAENNLTAIQGNIEEITKSVEETKNEITAQTARIKERRTQIIARLKELGEDTSGFDEKTPDYIN